MSILGCFYGVSIWNVDYAWYLRARTERNRRIGGTYPGCTLQLKKNKLLLNCYPKWKKAPFYGCFQKKPKLTKAAYYAAFEKELMTGLEPVTCALRMRCSTNWATLAKLAENILFISFIMIPYFGSNVKIFLKMYNLLYIPVNCIRNA